MINFCKSWLGFSNTPHLSLHPPRDGLSLLVAADFQKPSNILTSPAVKPMDRRDSSALRCCYGPGDYDGLRSCTESLGFESSDEIGAGAKPTAEIRRSRSRGRKKTAERTKREEELKFPPPLPSLNRNGQRSSYLKTVRKDGRILMTEVKIERQEMLRAFREDGRLRLDLVRPQKEAEAEEDDDDDDVFGMEEEETVRQRAFPLTGGDGFRRCHEMSRQHLHFWNARCVTTT